MKNLFLTIAIVLSFSASALASNIIDNATLLSTEKVELSMEATSGFILSTTYNVEAEDVALVFETNVSMVQIFNSNGELEMTFPVGSDELNLGLSLFEAGQYKVGFLVEGNEEVQFTNLLIK